MLNKQVNRNIKTIDKRIESLQEQVILEEQADKREQLMVEIESLADLRLKLVESKTKGSVKPAVVSGVFGLASMVLIMKYEETNILTTRAIGIATGMFKGSK